MTASIQKSKGYRVLEYPPRITLPKKSAPPRLLKITEVAEKLSCDPSSIYRWIASGELTTVTLPNGRKRIPTESYEALLKRMGVTA